MLRVVGLGVVAKVSDPLKYPTSTISPAAVVAIAVTWASPVPEKSAAALQVPVAETLATKRVPCVEPSGSDSEVVPNRTPFPEYDPASTSALSIADQATAAGET